MEVAQRQPLPVIRRPGRPLGPRPRRRGGPLRQQRRFAYIVATPILGIVVLFGLYPIVNLIWISFHQYSLFTGISHPFIGLAYYKEALLQDQDYFWNAALNTLYYPLIRLPIEVVLALLLAVSLRRIRRGRGVYLAAIFLPVATSLTAMSIVFSVMFNPSTGIIDRLLAVVGLPAQPFLESSTQALPTVAAVDIWHGLGFATVIIFAGLMSIDEEYYNAASIDGANAWQQFRYVTFPLIRPVLSVVLIMDTTYLFQLFTPIYVMTKGGPFNSTLNLPYLIYTSVTSGSLGYAAACSMLLFAMILVVVIPLIRFSRPRT